MALMVLILPLKWCLAVVLAAVFHELCHITAVRLCGGDICASSIGTSGAIIETNSMSDGKALLCVLAGPAGGFLLLVFARWIPRIALCAAMQSAYNLLPLSTLDGGRALQLAAGILFPAKIACKICVITEKLCLAVIIMLGIYGTFILRLGPLPILAAGFLFLKASGRKIPCK